MTNNVQGRTIIYSNHRIDLNNRGETLSFYLTNNYHMLGREPQYSPPIGLEVPGDWVVVSRCQACFHKVGNDYYIYDGDGKNPSSNRLSIKNKLISVKDGYQLKDGDEIKIGQNPQNWVTITYVSLKSDDTGTPPKQRSISLKNRSIILGRSSDAALKLDAPTVSRCHATIDTDNQGRYILYDHSTNGVFVNRQKVTASTLLSSGAIIQIGPYTFVLQGDELVLFDEGENIRIDAKNLERVVKIKNNKQEIKLLNDISLAVEPGQFVAIVGGSGSGKSTLLKTLLGIEKTTRGTVYLNGTDIIKNYNIYRNFIGYVPQNDIVHTNLTVQEVLYYAAKLRLSSDINVQDIIRSTLREIELYEHQTKLVKNLSGGQLKRVSIGVELLADPKLLFLDEPTSGLDPGLDKKMMKLLRRLADEGRTIILVTHATTNIQLCDRLVFLGLGGNLCYFGPPNKATEFFQINSGEFADIYMKLETKDAVIKEVEIFRTSAYKKEYIDNRIIEISYEQNVFSKKVRRAFTQQLFILIQRYTRLILRDRVYLIFSFLASVGIALLNLVIEKKGFFNEKSYDNASLARQVLFIFTCASIWTGFSSSLQEIVKESAIYLRERLVNLGLLAYLCSKLVTLGGLALLQTLLISIIIFISFDPPLVSLIMSCSSPESCTSNPFPWWSGIFTTTFLTILTSISLGLMVSASVKNSTQANSALPLLLLPQIIFAGVLFNIEKNPIGRCISWMMISHWSVSAYGILADVNNLIPPDTKNQSNIPFQPLDMFNPKSENLEKSWVFLLLHAIVYLLITFWLQKRKDIFK